MSKVQTPPRFPELAAAIARTGRTLASVSHDADCHAAYLSQVIRGHAEPSDSLKQRIAVVIGRPVGDLFTEVDR